jgi:hypothetical protein
MMEHIPRGPGAGPAAACGTSNAHSKKSLRPPGAFRPPTTLHGGQCDTLSAFSQIPGPSGPRRRPSRPRRLWASNSPTGARNVWAFIPNHPPFSCRDLRPCPAQGPRCLGGRLGGPVCGVRAFPGPRGRVGHELCYSAIIWSPKRPFTAPLCDVGPPTGSPPRGEELAGALRPVSWPSLAPNPFPVCSRKDSRARRSPWGSARRLGSCMLW